MRPSAPSAQAGSVVTIDADKVLLINGRKVFPITLSPGPPTGGKTPAGGDGLQELRDAGALLFRIAQTNNWNSQLIADQLAALDWGEQHGMYCLLNLRELSYFAAGDAATEAALRNLVNQFKNHPAMGVWKNKDEAWWGGVSVADLKRGYDVIRQEDTNHPVEQTHAPRGTVADLQPYNSVADVLAVDIYPVTAVGSASNPPITNTQVSQVGDWTKALSQVANGEKTYWIIEQIAFSGTTPPAHVLVFPTYVQSRFMAYQAVINGARGLMFFGGNVAATLNAQDTSLGWNWTFWNDVLKPVVQQLGDKGLLADALVAPVSTLPITMTGTTAPDVEFCVREVPPYIYILASKREGATTNVTFSGLPASAVMGDLLYESPRTVTAQNGQFTDSFAPWDVHVYRFTLTNQSPFIISQPQSLTNYSGTTATFSVTAGGTGPLSYQWRKNGLTLSNSGNVSGATASSLSLSGVTQSDVGNYDVVISGLGSLTSAPPAMLTVITDQSPIITAQPQSQTNSLTSIATFNVTAIGSGPLFYQWKRNGSDLTDGGNVSGAKTSGLTLAGVSLSDAGSYEAVVTGFGSLTSAPATLTVNTNQSPAITFQPQSRTNYPMTTATFSVAAEGTAPLFYQWMKNGVDLSDGGSVAGSATSTLVLTGVATANAGSYSVRVFNAGNFQVSSNATLTVVYPMPYYDPFAYGAGSNIGGQINGDYLLWSDIGTSTAGPYVTVQSHNLSVPGLKPSLGNGLQFGGLGKSARFSFPAGNPVTTGTLYYSFALQVLDTNGLTSSGIFIGGFNNSVGTQTGQPTVIGTRVYLRSTANGFNLGLSKASSTASDWVWDSRNFTTNDVLFIVGSYTFGAATTSDDLSRMWINPNPASFAAATEPAVTLLTASGADISASQIASFIFVQRSTSEPAIMRADELRIGKTWAEVTSVLLPTLANFARLGNGTFQFSYTNSGFQSYSVYTSSNLLNWTFVGLAAQISPGSNWFTDTNANSSQRFYQLRSP